jgi:hypothetical protein
MTPADLATFLEFVRKKTLGLLDTIAALPDPTKALGWRPGPGRAHVAWQMMHVAATDDRHLNVRMKGGSPHDAELVRRFAGGSTPDDDVPSVSTIARYLDERQAALLAHLWSLSEADLAAKPTPEAAWPYGEWFQVLAWHEAHHHGQAHLTLNLYRASQDAAVPRTGH